MQVPAKLRMFRFGDMYDAGITIYLTIVGMWFFSQQPPLALAPLFFADPAGAVFGKFFTKLGLNAPWYQNKTVVGTVAVMLFAFLSLRVPDSMCRFGIAVTCALCEAFGGKTYDNAFVAVPTLVSWLYFHGWANPI